VAEILDMFGYGIQNVHIATQPSGAEYGLPEATLFSVQNSTGRVELEPVGTDPATLTVRASRNILNDSSDVRVDADEALVLAAALTAWAHRQGS